MKLSFGCLLNICDRRSNLLTRTRKLLQIIIFKAPDCLKKKRLKAKNNGIGDGSGSIKFEVNRGWGRNVIWCFSFFSIMRKGPETSLVVPGTRRGVPVRSLVRELRSHMPTWPGQKEKTRCFFWVCHTATAGPPPSLMLSPPLTPWLALGPFSCFLKSAFCRSQAPLLSVLCPALFWAVC